MNENERLIKTMEEDLKHTMARIEKEKENLQKDMERSELLKTKIAELKKVNESEPKDSKHTFKQTNETLQEFCKQFGFDNQDNFHIEELESYNIQIIDKLGKILDVTQMMDLIMIQDKEDNFKRLMIQNSVGNFVEYN